MKDKELSQLIKISYEQVGLKGRDAARIYHAVVELDTRERLWRNRAQDAGWLPPTPLAVGDEG